MEFTLPREKAKANEEAAPIQLGATRMAKGLERLAHAIPPPHADDRLGAGAADVGGSVVYLASLAKVERS